MVPLCVYTNGGPNCVSTKVGVHMRWSANVSACLTTYAVVPDDVRPPSEVHQVLLHKRSHGNATHKKKLGGKKPKRFGDSAGMIQSLKQKSLQPQKPEKKPEGRTGGGPFEDEGLRGTGAPTAAAGAFRTEGSVDEGA